MISLFGLFSLVVLKGVVICCFISKFRPKTGKFVQPEVHLPVCLQHLDPSHKFTLRADPGLGDKRPASLYSARMLQLPILTLPMSDG